MTKDETTQEESIDQPTEESTPDHLQEESQDQPNVEVEEDQEDSEDSTEETEEYEESETIIIDGEEFTPEEAKELLNKGKHFTYNMQQLREKERQLAAMQQPAQHELTDEEKEIQEARKTLKRYGVVTEDDVDAKLRDLQMRQVQQAEAQAFRQNHPEITDFAMKMIDGAAKAWNMPYEQTYQQGWGGGTPQRKIVKKKALGAKKSATTPVSGKGGGAITRADISKMSMDEYNKNLPKIEELIRKGELQ